MIAKKGADAFYTGEIAWDLIHDVKTAGGEPNVNARTLFVRISKAALRLCGINNAPQKLKDLGATLRKSGMPFRSRQ